MFAAPLWAADAPEYMSLAGLKAQGFQKFLDDARDQGYEVNYINGYEVGDHVEFAGVAIKLAPGDKRQYDAKFDLTEDEFRDYIDDMGKRGFRPMGVSGYHTKKGTRFAAAWIKDSVKLQWKTRVNQPHKEYEDTVAAMRDDGLVPFAVSAYLGADGDVRYTSVFCKPLKGEAWDYRHNMTAAQFDDQLDKWHADGFRLMRVHAYETPDGLRFLAVVRNRSGYDGGFVWKVRHGMTGDEYQKEFDKMANEGYSPNSICGYRAGGEVRFVVNWEKRK
jgi:hypothetical protein